MLQLQVSIFKPELKLSVLILFFCPHGFPLDSLVFNQLKKHASWWTSYAKIVCDVDIPSHPMSKLGIKIELGGHDLVVSIYSVH